MNKRIKQLLTLAMVLLAVGATYGLYVWHTPHRDVQAAAVDIEISVADLVDEYTADATLANQKYLEQEGDSKILAVSGRIDKIMHDQNSRLVVLLKNEGDALGISCTFSARMKDSNIFTIGETTIIKVVIKSGPEYDEDLDLYEDAVLAECDILG